MNDRNGLHFFRVLLVIIGFLPALLATAGLRANADEPKEISREVREFKLLVNGTERGSATTTISVRDDGTEIMQGKASLEVNYIVYKYAYASAGWEIWKDGKLQKLRNVSNYNGDKYSLKGEVAGEKLQVEVNGKELELPTDVWPTSYWKNPTPNNKEKRQLVLLDSDLGKKLSGQLAYVGTEALQVGEKKVDTTHYQINGDVKVELWFDASNRLVRSESIEMGQKTIAELEKISN